MDHDHASYDDDGARGRRGGLGFKRGGWGNVSAGRNTDAQNDQASNEGSGSGGAARSNADFKAMFEKSREPKVDDGAGELG